MDFQGGTHTVEIQGNNHNVDALFEYYAYSAGGLICSAYSLGRPLPRQNLLACRMMSRRRGQHDGICV